MHYRQSWLIVALGMVMAGALPARAHHSAAMFDAARTESIQGVVRKFVWTNPHCWLYVTAKSAEGSDSEYSIEMTSPNLLQRLGWRPTSLKTGDAITVVMNPLRDARLRGGRIVSVTTSDGKVLTEHP